MYWRVDAGASIPQDGHIEELGPWSAGQKISYDVGFNLDAGFGYAFNKYFATEFELGGTWNYIDSVKGASLDDTSVGTMPILGNIILQYPIPQTLIVPFIGAGIGGAATFFDTDGFYTRVPGGSVTINGSDSDFVFAWQAIAGVRMDVNDRMSLGVSYRYLSVDPASYSFDSWYYRGPDLNVRFSRFESHLVSATFQIRF